MRSVRTSPRVLGILLGTVLAVGSVTVGSPAAAEPDESGAPPAALATAVVSLGDNGISGEGAGDYEPGTNGENGNWCHRSTNAMVHRTNLAQYTVNLACSGAKSVNVTFDSPIHYTEGSQAKRLADYARKYRVTTVIVRVGSNDDPNFSSTVVACIGAYLYPDRPSCSSQLRPVWKDRLKLMMPKVRAALADVKTAMSGAGYADTAYNLVLTSYASPITEHMDPEWSKGCPFRTVDAKWARTEATPQLNAALRLVANDAGARFLDLTRATERHEACSGGANPGTEWQTQITVDPWKLVNGELTPEEHHRAAESFHINAVGHKQLGICMTEFVRSTMNYASCIEGSDGYLHPVAYSVGPRG